MLVPYDDKRLLGSDSLIDVNASPFVIAASNAGLKGFDSFINVVILISVISIGMSGVYGGSRTLTALAEHGFAPSLFKYIDKAGRPLPATGLILAFGLLAYVNLAAAGPTIFNWLLALSGLAALFTWGSICLAHIRFRQAWKYHGHTVDEIPFQAIGGVYGSYMGIFLIFLVLIAQVSRYQSSGIGKCAKSLSFTSPLHHPVRKGRRDTTAQRVSSKPILPCPLSYCFGSAVMPGSARDGSVFRR